MIWAQSQGGNPQGNQRTGGTPWTPDLSLETNSFTLPVVGLHHMPIEMPFLVGTKSDYLSFQDIILIYLARGIDAFVLKQYAPKKNMKYISQL